MGELILVVRDIRGRGQALAGLMGTAINMITPVSCVFSVLKYSGTWCSGWAHVMSAADSTSGSKRDEGKKRGFL
jgi:hypothetical protein